MNITTSKMILSALSRNNEFSSKVYPHLKEEYFSRSERVLFNIIKDFISRYASLPTKEALMIELERKQGLNESEYHEAVDTIPEIFEYNLKETKWLIDTAEKYCKDVALQLALQQAISITDSIASGKPTNLSETAIPDLLSKAISVSFGNSIGDDYIETAEERYDRYNVVEDKIPFEINMLNSVTNNGFSKKRMHIFIGGVGGAKTLSKCSLAASNLIMGKNVLYVTLEIDKDELAKRIDANLLDVDINNVHILGKSVYVNDINSIKKKTLGKLVIYEDMSGQFNSVKLKNILEELKLKKNFIPDVVYVDYLGICTSSVYKAGSTTSYIYYKAISEEFRSICNIYNFCLITSMQLNRSNFDNSDAGLTGIADSFGVAHTADWIGILINTDELKALNQIEISQVKSRYSDLNYNKRFLIGIDRARMRLYDLDQNFQSNTYIKMENSLNNQQLLGLVEDIAKKHKLDFSLE